ncbi:hypothetical protein Len3610_08330 [Lentibacillus sp. CBA3610]|nr:hypothetical protein Len3610_08330 [Lentibacillus sp. CBA3610]
MNLFIAHGHLHQVKSNPLAIRYRGEEQHAQVVCFGHTHTAERVPGSVLLPRGEPKKNICRDE